MPTTQGHQREHRKSDRGAVNDQMVVLGPAGQEERRPVEAEAGTCPGDQPPPRPWQGDPPPGGYKHNQPRRQGPQVQGPCCPHSLRVQRVRRATDWRAREVNVEDVTGGQVVPIGIHSDDY